MNNLSQALNLTLRPFLMVFAFLIAFSASSRAERTVYVDDENGKDQPSCGMKPERKACKTINYALKKVVKDRDILALSSGSYAIEQHELAVIDIPEELSVTIQGDPEGGTIIDGQNKNRGAIYAYDGFSGKRAHSELPDSVIISFNHIEFRNCVSPESFSTTGRTSQGGAVYIAPDNDGSYFEINFTECHFFHNSAKNSSDDESEFSDARGGAIAITGNAKQMAIINLDRCHFERNSATHDLSGGKGGALFLMDVYAIVDNCSFVSNKVENGKQAECFDLMTFSNSGGAIAVMGGLNSYDSEHRYTIKNSIFLSNSANSCVADEICKSDGGAIAIIDQSAGDGPHVKIAQNCFSGNSIDYQAEESNWDVFQRESGSFYLSARGNSFDNGNCISPIITQID